MCEAAIDALSLAAIERLRDDTLYAATAGGMGPATIAALQQLLEMLAADPAGILIAATDADIAGRRYAARLQRMATEAGVRCDAILPPDGLNDWNDALRAKTPDFAQCGLAVQRARLISHPAFVANESTISRETRVDGWLYGIDGPGQGLVSRLGDYSFRDERDACSAA